MHIEMFSPETRQSEDFAVAVPTNGPLAIIQSYPDRDSLVEGYAEWRAYAKARKITLPIPIQRDKGDQWRILKELIPE